MDVFIFSKDFAFGVELKKNFPGVHDFTKVNVEQIQLGTERGLFDINQRIHAEWIQPH